MTGRFTKELAAIEGLTLADCLYHFDQQASDRDKAICALADNGKLIDNDGGTERDHNLISEGDDNGAYILTWTWFDFAMTPFDKEAEPPDEDDPAEQRAFKSGWRRNSADFDQWEHPDHPHVYRDAADIPENLLTPCQTPAV